MFLVKSFEVQRVHYYQPEGARPPSQSSAPSERSLSGSPLNDSIAVPPYHNWFAVLLCDLFKSDDLLMEYKLCGMDIVVPKDRLEHTVDQFIANCAQQQKDSLEYTPSALLTRSIDRFIFSDEDYMRGACLAQYTVFGTQRTDWSLSRFLNWLPTRPELLHSDYKPKEMAFKQADIQTQLYSINSVQGQDRFPWFFGLPCCPSVIKLQIHFTANRSLLYIDIAQVTVENTTLFRKFLGLLYGAVHWLLNNEQNSSLPPGCSPLQSLTLRDNFKGHSSQRVFLQDGLVYKFYENDDAKIPNLNLMKELDYFDELQCQPIGNSYTLLSYKALPGSLEPSNENQIYTIAKILDKIHTLDLVHADIRIGNLIFGDGDTAYIIDFDFTGQVDEHYHERYNSISVVQERHVDAVAGKAKQYHHDWFSLGFITEMFFPFEADMISSLKQCKSATWQGHNL